MTDLLNKISSYNLFNNLMPGILFVILVKYFVGYNLEQENVFIGLFLYYFIGMTISRISSIGIEPLLKFSKVVTFRDYKLFIEASKKDDKLDILVEYFDCKNGSNEESAAKAEDWAFITIRQGNKSQLWDVGKAGVASSCYFKIDTDQEQKRMNVALGLMNVIGNPDRLSSQDYRDSLLGIIILMVGDTLNYASPCEDQTKQVPLLHNTKEFTIKSNEETEIIMSSMHDMYAMGRSCAKGDARITSDFHLLLYSNTNEENNESKYCCSKKVAVYDLFAYDRDRNYNNTNYFLPSELSVSEHQDRVFTKLNFTGPWYAPYNSSVPFYFDLVTGLSTQNCDDVHIQSSMRPIKKINNEAFEFEVKDDNLFVTNKNQETFNFVVYDALGRKLDSGTSIEGNSMATNMGKITKNQALFIAITVNGETKTLKVLFQ